MPLTPLGQATEILLKAFEDANDEWADYSNRDGVEHDWNDAQCRELLNACDVCRHAILHLVDPMWERRWPTATREE